MLTELLPVRDISDSLTLFFTNCHLIWVIRDSGKVVLIYNLQIVPAAPLESIEGLVLDQSHAPSFHVADPTIVLGPPIS